jgi:hypothetical protein
MTTTDNKKITLKLIGFNTKQIENFSAILTLAESKLNHSWELVQSIPADFFLLSENVQQQKHSLSYECCLFISAAESAENEHILLVDRHGLPRLRSVVEVFNSVAHKKEQINAMSQQNQVGDNVETVTTQSEPELIPVVVSKQELVPTLRNGLVTIHKKTSFEPRGLLKLLLNPPANYFVCSPDETFTKSLIYVCAITKTCYLFDSTDLESYVTGDIAAIRTIGQSEFEQQTQHLVEKSLKNLIWILTFKLSKGQLLTGHSERNIVRLTDWPDLSINECRDYMKLIAFMRRNALPLSDVAYHTDFNLIEVNNFYNACYLVGLIEIVDTVILNKQNKRPNLSILSKINQCLEELKKEE